MQYRKRKVPLLNSSSTADIAFLLLIFFLVTSSLDSQLGIYRKMRAERAEEALQSRTDIAKRNFLSFTINNKNKVLYNDKEIGSSELRDISKTFIANPNDLTVLPEKELMEIPEIGMFPVSDKHIISLIVSRESNYQTYLSALNEITAAYNELRNEVAHSLFHVSFDRLTLEQKNAIRLIYPLRVVEKEIGEEGVYE